MANYAAADALALSARWRRRLSVAAAAYLQMLPVEKYPYMHALTARVADGAHDGTLDFSFGLEVLLDGLGRRRANGS